MKSIETGRETTQLVALKVWRRAVGVSDTTAWRWAQKGWIHPINIAGRPYLREADAREFERRAAAGEFSKLPKVPSARKADRGVKGGEK